MRKLLLIILITLSGISLNAQTNLDSLFSVWHDQTLPDTTRLTAMNKIALTYYQISQPDSAIYFAQMQYEFAETSGKQKWMAHARMIQGKSFKKLNNAAQAIVYYEKSIEIFAKLSNENRVANILVTIGNICHDQGAYVRALEYLQKGLKRFELLGDKRGIANSLGTIGLIYNYQGDYSKALEYYEMCFELKQAVNDRPELIYINLGSVYTELGNYSKAREYFQKAIDSCEVKGDYNSQSRAYVGLAINYKNQADYSNALHYFQKSLEFFEEIGNNKLTAGILSESGSVQLKIGNQESAIKKCWKGLQMAEEIGSIQIQKIACTCLYKAYKAAGNGNKALEFHEKMLQLDSSLQVDKTSKMLQNMEFQKVMLADSLAKADEARLVQEAHKEEMAKEEKTRNIGFVVGFIFLLAAGGFYTRWRYVRKSKAIIEKEKDRSENLLLNILPAEIAQELKDKGEATARDFDMVSILFTDFKGFTEQSEKMSAADLVKEINHNFKAFDAICERYKVEKIKTIGDAYMAAGGLPIPSNDSIKNTVLAAIEMQDFIVRRFEERTTNGQPAFEMRVGIHTGPVVAGIVGVKKFQYDIWGDTVNTASRIESSGHVGQVNISQATYEFLKDDSDFTFETRGKIEAKGKGEIEMYFVSKK